MSKPGGMRRYVLEGLVWFGFEGELKRPPCYIIPRPASDGIFVSDVLRKFAAKRVKITIETISEPEGASP